MTVIGSALLLPLPVPDRSQAGPGDGYGLSDSEIEQIAVRMARQYEVNRGATVTSVEQDHVGFDLLSRAAWSAAASRSRDGLESPGWS